MLIEFSFFISGFGIDNRTSSALPRGKPPISGGYQSKSVWNGPREEGPHGDSEDQH